MSRAKSKFLFKIKKIYFPLVGVLLIIIILLLYKIYFQNSTEQVSINPIQSSNLIFPDKNSEYFYEPKPGTIENYDLVFLENKAIKAVINLDSLNENADYEVNKDPSVFRIITLGDSFTYGWYVNTSENYPEQLENRLNNTFCPKVKRFEVINLGVPGYDIEFAVQRYKTRGQKYDPDLMLWFLLKNDFTEFAGYINFLGHKKYNEIANAGRLNEYKENGLIENPGWYEAKKEIAEQVDLETIVDHQTNKLYSISDYYSGKLIVFTKKIESSEYQNKLSEFARKRPQTFFLNSIHLEKNSEDTLKDSHPTAKGYTKISDSIYEYLFDNQLIPCK